MSEQSKGVLAMVGACLIWGCAPVFYKQLAGLPPLEVLMHRTIWSLVFFAAILAAMGRLGEVRAALSTRRSLTIIAFAAILISVNWFTFIFAVLSGKALEASLGYFIFPLVSVLFGVAFFGEKLGRAKALSVGLATFAVALLTYGLGVVPWISLLLAGYFVVYGVIKRRSNVGPIVGVTAEVVLLSPLALAWLYGVHRLGWGGSGGGFGRDWWTSFLLIASGPLTGGPLILFSYAAKRVTMSTLGLLQYVNPSLQFLAATLVFHEPFGRWHATAFPIIWAALALYSAAAVSGERAARRAASSAGMSSAT